MNTSSIKYKISKSREKVVLSSIAEIPKIPAIYGFSRKSISVPLIVAPYRDPADPNIKWVTVFKPEYKSKITRVRVIKIRHQNELCVVTYLRHCRHINPYRTYQVIMYLQDKGITLEDIAVLTDIYMVRTIQEYTCVKFMDRTLWEGVDTQPDKIYPTMSDVRSKLKFVPNEYQKTVWNLVRHIDHSLCRRAVIDLIVTQMGIIPKRGCHRVILPERIILPSTIEVEEMYRSVMHLKEKHKKK